MALCCSSIDGALGAGGVPGDEHGDHRAGKRDPRREHIACKAAPLLVLREEPFNFTILLC